MRAGTKSKNKTTPTETVNLLKKLNKEYEANKKNIMDNCEHVWTYDNVESDKHQHKYGGMNISKCVCGATQGSSY